MKNHKILKYSYWLSVACLIHCIAFPLFIAVLPFLNMAIHINHFVELIILTSVFIFGTYALTHAYFTHHKNPRPILIFAVGFLISFYTHVIAHSHGSLSGIILEIFSGVLIAGSQFYNIKITPRTCSH